MVLHNGKMALERVNPITKKDLDILNEELKNSEKPIFSKIY
jgi:hypothetical protein